MVKKKKKKREISLAVVFGFVDLEKFEIKPLPLILVSVLTVQTWDSFLVTHLFKFFSSSFNGLERDLVI